MLPQICDDLSIVPWSILFPSLLLFDWWTKMWEITEEVLMNCNSLYLLCHTNCQMHEYMVASSIKIIKMQCFYNVLIQVSQDGFMFRLIIVCVLGLWFANTVAAKIVIQHSYDHRLHHRLFSPFTDSPHKLPFYAWTILIDLHVFLTATYQYSCFIV